MKIDGSCQCGGIAFEAEVDPKQVNICHCTDCQAFSGSAFRIGIAAPAKDFKIKSGKPKTYVKTAETGAKRAQVFCPDCGTHLYATAADPKEATVYRLRYGAVRQRHELTPSTQIWCRSAAPWVNGIAAIPARERQ
jgi:hypothetical protein